MERWSCQEGIEAKRNIRAIYLKLGKKYFLLLCLSLHVWGSCNLELHPSHCLAQGTPWKLPPPQELSHHTQKSPSKLPIFTFWSIQYSKIFLSGLHWTAVPVATYLPWEKITKRNGKMLPHLWVGNTHPTGITAVVIFPLVAYDFGTLSWAVQLELWTPSVSFNCDGYKTRPSIFKE